MALARTRAHDEEPAPVGGHVEAAVRKVGPAALENDTRRASDGRRVRTELERDRPNLAIR